MKFTIVTKIEWEKLPLALETWCEDKDYKIREDFAVHPASNAKLRVGVYVVANGLDDSTSKALVRHLRDQDIRCTIVEDSFLGPFLGSLRVGGFWVRVFFGVFGLAWLASLGSLIFEVLNQPTPQTFITFLVIAGWFLFYLRSMRSQLPILVSTPKYLRRQV